RDLRRAQAHRLPRLGCRRNRRQSRTRKAAEGRRRREQEISRAHGAHRMSSPFRVAVISDEITQDFGRALEIITQDFGMQWVEIRGLWNKNALKLDAKEIAEARALLEKFRVRV